MGNVKAAGMGIPALRFTPLPWGEGTGVRDILKRADLKVRPYVIAT